MGKKRKNTPLGVMTGASRPRGSPGEQMGFELKANLCPPQYIEHVTEQRVSCVVA